MDVFFFFFRFFLMYLINKDETEHTGQVSVDSWYHSFRTEKISKCLSVKAHAITFSASGVIRVEDVPRALLGLLPCWRLFQKAI